MKRAGLLLLLLTLVLSVSASDTCRGRHVPVVLVHGFLASGDTWAPQVQRFVSQGYCRDDIFVFDWNTVGGSRRQTDSLLDAMIDSARRTRGSLHVDLAGHSAGGGVCTAYLSDSAHAVKVRHYVHIGSSPLKQPAGRNAEVATLVISSRADKVTGYSKDSLNPMNLVLKDQDHAEVQTCEETFRAIYSFFNDRKPVKDFVQKNRIPDSVSLSGRAVYFGDNQPVQTDSLLVFLLDGKTGQRITARPYKILSARKDGCWPAVVVPQNSPVEFEIHPPGGRVISYYLPSQARDNDLLYLRCIPKTGLAAGIFKKLPSEEGQSAIAIFSAKQAIIAGRDRLMLDSLNLSTPELTPPSRTVLASFVFDDGGGAAPGTLMKGFGTGVFLNGVNARIAAGNNKSVTVQFNQSAITVPARPSSEALMVVIF